MGQQSLNDLFNEVQEEVASQKQVIQTHSDDISSLKIRQSRVIGATKDTGSRVMTTEQSEINEIDMEIEEKSNIPMNGDLDFYSEHIKPLFKTKRNSDVHCSRLTTCVRSIAKECKNMQKALYARDINYPRDDNMEKVMEELRGVAKSQAQFKEEIDSLQVEHPSPKTTPKKHKPPIHNTLATHQQAAVAKRLDTQTVIQKICFFVNVIGVILSTFESFLMLNEVRTNAQERIFEFLKPDIDENVKKPVMDKTPSA